MRKFFILLLLVVGFAFMNKVSVSADTMSAEKAMALVERANARIEQEIQKAIEKEASLPDDRFYEARLDRIIDVLLFKTERISRHTIRILERAGFEAECEYVVVIIGERVVYVDPIRVHSW